MQLGLDRCGGKSSRRSLLVCWASGHDKARPRRRALMVSYTRAPPGLRLRRSRMTAASEPACPTSHSLRKPCYARRTVGGNMSADTLEKVITNAIHTAFIKYP